MKRAAILMKYLVFLLGCGLVLAGFTSWFANPTDMQVVFSALAAILGALLVTLGLAKPPIPKKEKTNDEKLAEQVVNDEDDLDLHNSFHSPSDVFDDSDQINPKKLDGNCMCVCGCGKPKETKLTGNKIKGLCEACNNNLHNIVPDPDNILGEKKNG